MQICFELKAKGSLAVLFSASQNRLVLQKA